jgi:NTE family protein
VRAGSAVVLGPGGPVGTAWLAGLAAGLRREGVDLGAAALIVGTSAGAIVGALLAGGGDPSRLATPAEAAAGAARVAAGSPGASAGAAAGSPGAAAGAAAGSARAAAGPAALADPAGVRTDPDRLAEVFATLGDSRLDRAEALRRIGLLAITAATGTQEAAIARMRNLVGTAEWPGRPLLIPSVDAESGEAMIWDRHGAASLPEALAASTAFPATAPPITINGRRYIDGALRAGANADLAGDADVVIMAEPMAHVFGTTGTTGTKAGSGAVVRLIPDPEAIAAFGPDMTSLATWVPAFQAGLRQASQAARLVRAVGR